MHRPAENCGPTTNGVEKLQEWLEQHGERPWDVIHYNFGRKHSVHFLVAGSFTLVASSRCAPEDLVIPLSNL